MKCKQLVLLVLLSTLTVLVYALSYAWRRIGVPTDVYLWGLLLGMTLLSFAVGRGCRQKVTSRVRIVPSGDVILPLVGGVGIGLLLLRWINAKMFLPVTVGFTFSMSLLLFLLLATSKDNAYGSAAQGKKD